MTLATQADFARLKGVSRKTVTQWKRDGRLVFTGTMLDVEASQTRLQRLASNASRGQFAPIVIATSGREQVTAAPARYRNRANYGNPANLPDEPISASTAIECGAIDMAKLTLRRLPSVVVKSMINEWVRLQRLGCVGSEGGMGCSADEWPDPPIGYKRWSEHPLFLGDPLENEWEEIETAASGA